MRSIRYIGRGKEDLAQCVLSGEIETFWYFLGEFRVQNSHFSTQHWGKFGEQIAIMIMG